MHGGSVKAYGDGTRRGGESVALRPARKEAAGRRILLVEDHGDGRQMLADLLRLWGHEVEEAADGPAGLERLRQVVPDVALIDIGLPGLDGYELARRARGGGRRVRLIAVTGYGQPADRRRALEAGFDAHLVKPVNLEQLRRLLDGTSRAGGHGDERGEGLAGGHRRAPRRRHAAAGLRRLAGRAGPGRRGVLPALDGPKHGKHPGDRSGPRIQARYAWGWWPEGMADDPKAPRHATLPLLVYLALPKARFYVGHLYYPGRQQAEAALARP